MTSTQVEKQNFLSTSEALPTSAQSLAPKDVQFFNVHHHRLTFNGFLIVLNYFGYYEGCCFEILIYVFNKQIYKSLLGVFQGVDAFLHRIYTCLTLANIAKQFPNC